MTARIEEAVLISVLGGLTLAILLWLGRTINAKVQGRRARELARDHKLDRIIEYHEGSPGDPAFGVDPVPGIQERFERIEKQVTPNGGDSDTLGDRVQRVERLALGSVRQNEKIMALLLAHLEDGEEIMRIGVENDTALWDRLRAFFSEHGVDFPDYQYPPSDVVFSMEDLERRLKEKGSDGTV